MHSSRIFSSFQEIMAGERAACLLDQASIAKVAKSIRILIHFLCRAPAYPAQRSRTFCPIQEDSVLLSAGNRRDESHAVADNP
jgi:hypothetical protein